LDKSGGEKLTKEKVESALDEIKGEISSKVREMSVTGESLIEVISRGAIPEELKSVVNDAIRKTGVPESVFMKNLPA